MGEEKPQDGLAEDIRALREELRSLRAEVQALKSGKAPLEEPALAKADPPAPAPAAAPAAPAKPVTDYIPFYNALFGTQRIELKRPIKTGPLAKAAPGGPPAPKASPSSPSSSWSFDEQFVGEKLLQYAGMVVLALGVLFFLIWRAAHTGPAERVFMASAAGAVLLALGWRARGDERYKEFAQTLTAGGWTVLYLTAYAASHFEPTRIIESSAAGLGVLGIVALGMIGQALDSGSRPFRLYAFGLSYFVFFFCREEVTSFDLYLVLHMACVLVAAETGEADVLWVSLAGYHASYVPLFVDFLRLPQSHTLSEFVRLVAWQGAAYLAVGALPFVPRARERLTRPGQETLFDGALSLNALAFIFFAGVLGRAYFGHVSLQRAALLSLFFAIPGLLYLRVLPRKSTAAGLCAVLTLGTLAASVFSMPSPMWKMVAWGAISCAGVWLGLFFDAPVWRATGVTMSLLTFLFYAQVAAGGEDARRSASAAMFVFSGLSYLFARFYRVWLADAEEWEKPAGEAWLYGGTAALILALWGVLDAAPFLCALVALCLLGEVLAVRLPRLHLWVQASVLELLVGLYSLFVDYGVNASTVGLSPRLLVTAVMAAGWAYLYIEDPMDEALSSKWKAWSRADQRVAITWVALMALSFAVYKEFDGFLRLPIWAFAAAGLYALGRTAGVTHFKQQSLVLALGTAVEAVATYLTAPSAIAAPRGAAESGFFWLSCAALLSMVLVAKERRWGEPTGLDQQMAQLLSIVSLVLMASFCAKELDAMKLTMAWTALGTGYLLVGMMAGWRELRLPALCLLGICVGKALLLDTSRLPLPYRVASFIGLGVVLLFGSSLYVRMEHEENAASARDD
jgi:hypothetical protein